MKKSRILTASLAAVSMMTVSACVTDPNTGERKVSRTVLGTAGGALAGGLLGGVIGGKTGRIIGAAAGGVAGGVVGYNMDQQIKELEEQTAGSGVDVSETDGGEAILVNLPDGVTFATGSYTITPGFRDLLDRVASSLTQYPNSLVDVYGHTDTVGSADSNQRLSEQRAQAVANYLTSRGVDSSRIRWMGFGETRPKVSTGDNVNEPLNRRVEIKIIPFDQQDIQAAQSQGM
ncbi:MAG TPA: OmpA family protein [Erythrobacter sp.]|jgi:outer membrane protein OmpA-like peptidoglycan-associated protein|uniref:OmpA family protein n=2 Tax=Qipengyuania citrea TaxID=225971 RepID=A0A6I4UBI6_9SPHN|nr:MULTISPECIES: OmpA family protein [Erythrobacteraceae]MAC31941.1 OmpA family protein [Erythrobacter sp.]MAL54675.1 OmpA family protein [Sphingomonadaceae bacterium]MBN92108.1 OmpA family protein [Erythrobacteraceae bacterium]MCZ4264238.1 OmpA family protein [Erythrobacter sp. G21629-S1]KNH00650.1 outer membrane protein [Qipengyuania citrea LAMA 915]|tara:strand:- start:10 stop:705 length:696 start_codon:yes stop_codon:yes gene_type:complete